MVIDPEQLWSSSSGGRSGRDRSGRVAGHLGYCQPVVRIQTLSDIQHLRSPTSSYRIQRRRVPIVPTDLQQEVSTSLPFIILYYSLYKYPLFVARRTMVLYFKHDFTPSVISQSFLVFFFFLIRDIATLGDSITLCILYSMEKPISTKLYCTPKQQFSFSNLPTH